MWGEPISYGTPEDIEENYDRIGLAIAAYEASSEVNQFSSKYDYYLNGEAVLTEQEAWGLELFNREDKGNCAACHPSEKDGDAPPLFTDFTFDNLGVPKNMDNPFYSMDEVLLDDGTPINPLGDTWIDEGLGGFLESHPDASWRAMADDNMGKHKVPTLRNVDKRPGSKFPKAFMHNGVFKSLKEVVHFYNTRDVETWPLPEVAANVNTDELGNLGLTDAEEDAIVAFMKTLSDGYVPRGLNMFKLAQGEEGAIEEFQMLQNSPNPFNPTTTIQYTIPADYNGQVTLKIYDIRGALVKTLVDEHKNPGVYNVQWDGMDITGKQVSSGLYLYQLKAGMKILSGKMTFMR